MEQGYCPCCSNHCHREQLKCKRGKKFFEDCNKTSRRAEADVSDEEEKLTRSLKKLVRKCAKRTRREKDGKGGAAFNNLTKEEKQTLRALLAKLL